jgi:hypothetical protein
MKKTFAITVFMLATLAGAFAQQPGTAPAQSTDQATSSSSQTAGQSGSQATSPSSQMPGSNSGQATSPSSQTPGSTASQAPGASQAPSASATVTEGCLGGTNPNYTITDASGTIYKLNIPPNADTSKLAAHVGESVNVAGNVNGTGTGSAINVQGIGKGMGTCPAGGAKSSQPPQKQ